jgi:hypothetical protein
MCADRHLDSRGKFLKEKMERIKARAVSLVVLLRYFAARPFCQQLQPLRWVHIDRT